MQALRLERRAGHSEVDERHSGAHVWRELYGWVPMTQKKVVEQIVVIQIAKLVYMRAKLGAKTTFLKAVSSIVMTKTFNTDFIKLNSENDLDK